MITIYETIANEAAHPLALKVTLLCLMTAPFVNSFLFGFRNKSVQMIFLNYMRKELYKNEVQQVCVLNTVWKLQTFFRESTEFYCIYKNSVKSTFTQIFVTLLISRNIFRAREWIFGFSTLCVNDDEVVVDVENLVKVENSIYANLISRDFHRVSPVCFNLRQQTNSFWYYTVTQV